MQVAENRKRKNKDHTDKFQVFIYGGTDYVNLCTGSKYRYTVRS
jgi:hypothetical protein